MKKLLFIFLMLAVLTGCHGLRMEVGLKGSRVSIIGNGLLKVSNGIYIGVG